MKQLLVVLLLSSLSAAAMAGPGYDDELLKRETGYGDVIRFDEGSAAKVDLSRGEAVVHRQKPASEVASDEAISTLEEAQRLLNEAQNVRKKADEEYMARMNKLDRERELARQEYLARVEQGTKQQGAIVQHGREEAESLISRANYTYIKHMIDPIKIRNERIEINIERGSIRDIAEAIMPAGWVVKTDFGRKPELNSQLFTFTSTDSRDYALQNLCASVRDVTVTYQYFFDLSDNGKPTPMLLISDRKIY